MQQDRQGQQQQEQQPTDGMQAAYGNIRRLVEQTGRAATVSPEQLRTERDQLRELCARQWITALALKCYVMGVEQAGLSAVTALVDATLATQAAAAEVASDDDETMYTEEDDAANDELLRTTVLEQAMHLLK